MIEIIMPNGNKQQVTEQRLEELIKMKESHIEDYKVRINKIHEHIDKANERINYLKSFRSK